MKKYLDKLKEFNTKFNIHVEDIEAPPFDLRYELMREENEEYMDAESPEDVLDAVADMLYILCGTIVHHGLENKIEKAFNIVHSSNLSKLDENDKPIINGENGAYDPRKPLGKILKSKFFVEPDFSSILKD